MQPDLFADDGDGSGECIELPDAALEYRPAFLNASEAAAAFDELRATLAWRQDVLRFGGREVPIPRLNAWYGEAGTTYTYSGLRLEALPWTETLAPLRARIEAASGTHFDSVLANLYRDGRDSVAWHADDEPELGRDPVIASLSLGAVRSFELRHRRARALGLGTQRLALADGSLLVMRGSTQHHWLHRVPKEPAVTAARINLTFRLIRR